MLWSDTLLDCYIKLYGFELISSGTGKFNTGGTLQRNSTSWGGGGGGEIVKVPLVVSWCRNPDKLSVYHFAR